jgi:hypothetical protein
MSDTRAGPRKLRILSSNPTRSASLAVSNSLCCVRALLLGETEGRR